MTTWLEAHLAGDATLDDIDEWVERWHTATADEIPDDPPLNTYLGLTEDEYKRWVEEPSVLPGIVARYFRVRCQGCASIVVCLRDARECPECGFDAMGLGWAGDPDDPVKVPEFTVTVARVQDLEPVPPSLRDQVEGLRSNLSGAREALQTVMGGPDGEPIVVLAQRAATAVREARGNYAGACEDLKEIRRVVGAGEGSNVSSVTVAVERLKKPAMCSVCAGTGKPLSGKPCICDGVGTESAENTGLHQEVVRQEMMISSIAEAVGFDPNEDLELPVLVRRLAEEHGEMKKALEMPHGGEIADLEKQLGDSYAAKRLAMLARCAWQALAERDAAAKKFVDMQAAQGFQEKRADRLQQAITDFMKAIGYQETDGLFSWSQEAIGDPFIAKKAGPALAALQKATQGPTGKPEGSPYKTCECGHLVINHRLNGSCYRCDCTEIRETDA